MPPAPDQLATNLARWLPPDTPLCIALSGGLDSVVLAHLLKEWPRVRALHVNHQLQIEARAWADFVLTLCADWGIPCQVLVVDAQPHPGESPEAAARNARYAALADKLRPGEALLTGQHRDDQAETLLLQLFRGSGVRGLAGMGECVSYAGGWLVRPLLDCSRADLVAYAENHDLRWVEDPSNRDPRYRRNRLRHQLLPEINEHFPGVAKSLARTAAHCAEAAGLLDELAEADVQTCSTDFAIRAGIQP